MRRHDLMRATPEVWEAMLASHPGVAAAPLLRDWAREGRPFIVRRFLDGEAADGVPAAVPLPPSLGKRRLAFSFRSRAGLVPITAVPLDAVMPVLPVSWRAMAEALVRLDRERIPRVFGAVLWQHLTGLTYLSPTSDLDLLWTPSTSHRMDALIDALARLDADAPMRLDADAPMRLDGEIECPDGGGINWRELAETRARPMDEILVKTMQGVTMRRRSDLFPS